MDELLDIFDDQMIHTGAALRSQVHQAGWWHQTFHCWLYDDVAGEGMLLLQRRHLGKDTNPGKLDVSCAGHLAAGESPEDGVRELQEELGVAVSPQRLLKIGVARHQFRGNGVIDNEFSHVFVLRCHDVCDLHKFNVATDEVSGLYRISVRDLRGLVEGEVQSTEVAGIRWTDTGWEDDIRIVREADLVHREPSYYRLLWRHFGVL